MDEAEKLVGRHDDHDAEDDQHGECTGDADDFCLHGSADKYLETRAEQSAHHVHEYDGGEEDVYKRQDLACRLRKCWTPRNPSMNAN